MEELGLDCTRTSIKDMHELNYTLAHQINAMSNVNLFATNLQQWSFLQKIEGSSWNPQLFLKNKLIDIIAIKLAKLARQDQTH